MRNECYVLDVVLERRVREKNEMLRTSIRTTFSLIPCSRHAPGRLYLGHYATSAVVHPAQNMVFRHQMEPEIAPVSRKLRFFINHFSR